MTDETEAARRALVPEMPAHLVAAVLRGEPVCDTEGLTREFDVQGFRAPFVVVVRRSDGVRGTLLFTHNPRYYFNWIPE